MNQRGQWPPLIDGYRRQGLMSYESPRRGNVGPRGTPAAHYAGVDDGTQYDTLTLAFLKAMDRYKTEARRPFPTLAEVFDVARAVLANNVTDT